MNKAIFFDFNGTLTQNKNSFDFLKGKKHNKLKQFVYKFFGFLPIVRKLGLKMLQKELVQKNISLKYILTNCQHIKLKHGIWETFSALKKMGYKIVIISGGFKQVIENVFLINNLSADNIFANDLIFEKDHITQIQFNNCDFGGKKKIIKEYCTTNNISLQNAIFVGNSFNDKSALTLPIKKFTFGKTHKKNVKTIKNLTDILKYIN